MVESGSVRVLMLLENSSFPEDSRVLLQARTLTAAGYSVTVICPTEKGARNLHEIVEGIRVYRYPKPLELGGVLGYALEYGYSILMQFLLCLWVTLRRGFDTIHMHTPPDMNAVIPIFFSWFGKKFVYDLHDLSPELYHAQRGGTGNRLITAILHRFEQLASSKCTAAIATNESQRDIQVSRYGVPAEKYTVVRNGPNEAFLKDDIVARTDLPGQGMIRLGYVGVMGVQDGVDFLIRSLEILILQQGRKDLFAILVGDGSAKPDLEKMVTDLGLSDYVFFVGRVPFAQVPSYIAAFDICCTPDPSNPYNDSCTTIKTMEYMALGKPVVCFETSENMKTAGDAAIYAKHNDIKEFARAIELLANDRSLRSRMGQLGKSKIHQSLAWHFQAEKLVSLYDRLHGFPSLASDEDSVQQTQLGSLVSQHSSKRTLSDAHTTDLKVQFAFSGTIGKLFLKHLRDDCRQARLSRKFRIYYLMRPWIPTIGRSWLQSKRNRAIKKAEDWYIPHDFALDLKQAMTYSVTETDCGKNVMGEDRDEDKEVIHPWPDGFQLAVSLTHDIETAEGLKSVDAIARHEESLGLRSAWYFVAKKYRIDRGLVEDLRQRGHEVGIHGYNHDGRLFVSKSIFMRRVPAINAAGDDFCATGFRSPMVHRNLSWMQALRFEHDSSCFDVDPFQPMPGGVGSVWPFIVGKFVELPYTLPQDHTLMVTLGDSAYDVWLRKLNWLRKLSGMAMLITHPDYLDRPSRLDEYYRFCGEVATSSDAWKALPNDIATWWRQRQASMIGPEGKIIGPAQHRGRVVSLSSLFRWES